MKLSCLGSPLYSSVAGLGFGTATLIYPLLRGRGSPDLAKAVLLGLAFGALHWLIFRALRALRLSV